MATQLREFARDIKLEHSLFALPFAFIGAIAAGRATDNALTWRLAGLVLLAMVFARTAAMGYNRWRDAAIDARNPRTAERAIPAGRLAPSVTMAIVFVCMAGFVTTSFAINKLAGILSPVALLIILGYSETKRWTSASHLVLGLALALAPAGGWIAIAGSLHPAALSLAAGVLFWVAGFDVLYSLQDLEFDRKENLFSIPARWGESAAYALSRAFHALAIGGLVLFGAELGLGAIWFTACAIVAVILCAEQWLARDRGKIPMAFFHLNAVVGFVMLAGMIRPS